MTELTANTNKISQKEIEDTKTEALRAVRLIALRKTDGTIRPIGISEVVRRVLTKVIARQAKNEIKLVTGSIQCQGLAAACEAAYMAVDQMYQDGKVILILDAESAFNQMSRTSALKTAQKKAPHIPKSH